jgi:iron complex transport system substrate-binding protein
LRIVSFLPAATEMACALGLADQLVGVTYECKLPSEVRGKPVVVRNALPVDKMNASEIDIAVSDCLRRGRSLYEVDERLLEHLAPTHVLTQALCQVCAPSGNEITCALSALPRKPEILWFTPHRLEDVLSNLRDLGCATGRLNEAQALIASARARLQKTAHDVRGESRRPRVLFLEWIDPCYCCGHWVPGMIGIAGGECLLGRKGADSVRIAWSDIEFCAPEVLIVAPCGFEIQKSAELARQLLRQPGWCALPAIRQKRVFAVNANAYFARPGLRLIDGVELLAHLIHPHLCDWQRPKDAFRQVDTIEIEPSNN